MYWENLTQLRGNTQTFSWINKYLGDDLEIMKEYRLVHVKIKNTHWSSTPEPTAYFLDKNSDIEVRGIMESEHVN